MSLVDVAVDPKAKGGNEESHGSREEEDGRGEKKINSQDGQNEVSGAEQSSRR